MKRLLTLILVLFTLPALATAQCRKATKASISITGTGDATVLASSLAGGGSDKIYVWQFFVVNGHASQDVNITLKEGSTSISGAYLLKAAGGSHQAPCTGTPWAVVPNGSAFIINTDASGTIKGTVYYTVEP